MGRKKSEEVNHKGGGEKIYLLPQQGRQLRQGGKKEKLINIYSYTKSLLT